MLVRVCVTGSSIKASNVIGFLGELCVRLRVTWVVIPPEAGKAEEELNGCHDPTAERDLRLVCKRSTVRGLSLSAGTPLVEHHLHVWRRHSQLPR